MMKLCLFPWDELCRSVQLGCFISEPSLKPGFVETAGLRQDTSEQQETGLFSIKNSRVLCKPHASFFHTPHSFSSTHVCDPYALSLAGDPTHLWMLVRQKQINLCTQGKEG